MHILLFLYSNETGGLMTSVTTVRSYVYSSSVVLFPLQKDIHKPEEELFEVCRGTSSALSLCITLPTRSDCSTVFPL